MNWDRVKIDLETAGVRGRANLRLAVRVIGVALVLMGAYNLFGAPLTDGVTITVYREWLALVSLEEFAGPYASEIAIMAIGAALAWFVG